MIPGQGSAVSAWELLITGIAIGGLQIWINARSPRWDQETPLTWIVARAFPVMSCACLVVAGGTLLAQAGGGLYWLVPAVLAAFIVGLVNTWVLLVEILR